MTRDLAFAKRAADRANAAAAKRKRAKAPTSWPGKRFQLAALPANRMLTREDRGWSMRAGWDGEALQVEGSA